MVSPMTNLPRVFATAHAVLVSSDGIAMMDAVDNVIRILARLFYGPEAAVVLEALIKYDQYGFA